MNQNDAGSAEGGVRMLSQDQIDIIGEVSNISMGSAATALSNIIGKKVIITSPKVEFGSPSTVEEIEQIPSIGVIISYTEGVIGKDFLIVRRDDATKIVEALMGGAVDETEEFGELQLSAIAEVMNQMMGSSATALSGFIGKTVNISPPEAFMLTEENKNEKLSFIHENQDKILLVRFLFSVENMLESDIYMIMTDEFANELVSAMMLKMGMLEASISAPSEPGAEPSPQPSAPPAAPAAPAARAPQPVPQAPAAAYSVPEEPDDWPQMPNEAPARPVYAARQEAAPARAPVMATSVRPVQLPVFDAQSVMNADENANFELIQEVPLELSVEVGRAKKLVKEIIDLSVGSIVELDKQAGDPVDIIVNGQLIAHGEVVVIDESFGVRITEIIRKQKSY